MGGLKKEEDQHLFHFYQASILELVSGLNSGVYVLMY